MEKLVKVGLGCGVGGGAPIHTCLDSPGGTLVDNSLRVDPAVLDTGALQLRDCHEALAAVLAKVASGQDVLRGVWTGDTATHGDGMWCEVHDSFTAHIDRLATNAEDLRTAAASYRTSDQQSRSALDRRM